MAPTTPSISQMQAALATRNPTPAPVDPRAALYSMPQPPALHQMLPAVN